MGFGHFLKAKAREITSNVKEKIGKGKGDKEEEEEEDPDLPEEERREKRERKRKEARRQKAAQQGKILIEQKEVKSGGIGRAKFIYSHQSGERSIKHYYDLEKKRTGEGSFAVVQKGTNRSTGKLCAVKVISKGQMKCADRFHAEIEIMKLLDHPNIIKLFESYEDKKSIYVVMECCLGGELFDKIIDEGHLTEVQAALIMQQILRGVFYMHSMGIIHRDIKPENFLFLTDEAIEKGNVVKCIDFGLSRSFGDDPIRTKVGTPYYVSPQILAGKYDKSADMWSCGALLYVMLCGYPPFYGESDADILTKVRMGNFEFNQADWKSISDDVKNLIRMLMKMNPRDRWTAEQALNSSWINEKATSSFHVSLNEKFVAKLRKFTTQHRLKKATLHVIASQLPETQIKPYRDIFIQMDTNGDGMLTLEEFEAGLKFAGLKESQIPQDLAETFNHIDQDGSGFVDYTEFLAACLEEADYTDEEVLWSAFRIFDKSGDGMVSRSELEEVLAANEKEAVDQTWVNEIMAIVDTGGLENEIDFNEFLSMMRGKTYKQDLKSGRRVSIGNLEDALADREFRKREHQKSVKRNSKRNSIKLN